MDMAGKVLFIILLLLGMTEVLSASSDAGKKKMCWAHYVGWGFNLVDGYDKAALSPTWMLFPFNDRTLLGRNLQWDTGIYFGARKQIDTARAYGIDGFCVNVIDPAAYCSALSRFFRDSEGTEFKIALCIDRISYPNDYLLKHLGKFIERYKNHPNACRIDGKMVIFVYNARGKKIAEWIELRNELRKRNLEAWYFVQPMRETSMWDDPEQLQEMLCGYDSFYDFGCNGFTPEQMRKRLANGRDALKRMRPNGLLVGGIAVGYIGQSSGFYRPFLNTGTLRHNWEAALANGVDWVCLTTWNDYIEQTQFEPSVLNRDVLLRINREYLDLWRGTEPVERPPRVCYSYHDEVVIGDDLTIEILGFTYTTPAAAVQVRLLDESGKVLHKFPAVKLDPKKMTVETLRLTHDQLQDFKVIRVQSALIVGNGKTEFKELHPIIRRLGRLESVRTVRLSQDDMTSPTISLLLGESDGSPIARIRINSWTFAGKYELLRNGWPVAEGEISHFWKPVCEIVVPLPPVPRSPEDIFLVRLTDVSRRVGFSNPALFRSSELNGTSMQAVIITGSDFDENWPLWHSRISRLQKPELRNMKIYERDVFKIRYDFLKEEKELLVSNSNWRIPARLGRAGGFGWGAIKEAMPKWQKGVGPNGSERMLLWFDGDNDNIGIASRTMPYGPFTIEMLLKPEAAGKGMTLFSDCCGITLSLNRELFPVLARGRNSVVGKKELVSGKWFHLAAVYTGNALKLYLNGEKIGEEKAATFTIPVNSLPRIGNTHALDSGFRGMLAGFSLEGAVRSSKEFQLKL